MQLKKLPQQKFHLEILITYHIIERLGIHYKYYRVLCK
jgi:hypothetical protein